MVLFSRAISLWSRKVDIHVCVVEFSDLLFVVYFLGDQRLQQLFAPGLGCRVIHPEA